MLTLGVDVPGIAVRQGLGAWVLPGATIDLDFANGGAFGVTGAASSYLTTSRASVGYANDQAGNWVSFAPGVPRITNNGLLVEEARTNSIRNNSMQGAVVGADGVELLLNRTLSGSGLVASNWTVNQTGTINFTPSSGVQLTGDGTTFNNYIAQQVTGLVVGRSYVVTVASSSQLTVVAGNSPGDNTLTGNAAVNGNGNNVSVPDRAVFTATATSHWVSFTKQGASLTTLTSVSVQDGERVQNGGFTSNPINASQNTIQNGWQWNRAAGAATPTWDGISTVTLTPDGTNVLRMSTGAIPTVAGTTYTVTLTLASNTYGVYVGTTAFGTDLYTNNGYATGTSQFQFTATSATSYLNFGKFGTGAATISNVSVKSAGALPTNWSFYNPAALIVAVTSISGPQGVDAVTFSVSGTPGVNSLQLFIDSPVAAATVGQTWAYSGFLSYSNTTNITSVVFDTREVNNALATLGENTSSSLAVSSVLTRFSNTATLSQATTAFVQPLFIQNFANGPAVNYSFTVGWPQLELGASVTSPIRTTAAAATRAADAVTLTSPPAFGAAQTLFVQATRSFFVTGQFPYAMYIGQSDSVKFISLSTNQFADHRVSVKDTTTQWDINSGGIITANTVQKWALAAQAADFASAYNGASGAVQASGTFPTYTSPQVYIGQLPGANWWNGFIQRVAIWPSTRISNATLKSITT